MMKYNKSQKRDSTSSSSERCLKNLSKTQIFPFLSLPVWTVELKEKQKLCPNSHELPHTNWYLPLGSWISFQITSVESSFPGGCANPDKYLRCRYLYCKHLNFAEISLSGSLLLGKKLLFNFTYSFTCEK